MLFMHKQKAKSEIPLLRVYDIFRFVFYMTTASAFIAATWFPTVEYNGYNEPEGQNSS